MQAYRPYAACQSDDDLPYVLKYTDEDNMLMGTDYGHHDHAADLEGLRNLQDRWRDQRAGLQQNSRCQPQSGLRVIEPREKHTAWSAPAWRTMATTALIIVMTSAHLRGVAQASWR